MLRQFFLNRLAPVACRSFFALTLVGWSLSTAAEAPAPKPLREFDVDLTVYVKETQVVDGHGTTLLLEIVNTSGHKVRVTGPPLVRRLEAGEGQRGARAGRADATLPAGSAPMGPVAPERLPKPAEPPAGDAAPKADADPEVVSALPVVTCTLSEGAQPRPLVRSGLIAGRTKTLSPGDSYYLHVDLRADEMAPGACRIEAALVSKSRTIGKSQAVTVQCVARESRPQTQGDK